MISKDFSRVESVENALNRTAIYIIEMTKTIKVNRKVNVIIDYKLYEFDSLNHFIKDIYNKKGYNIKKENGYQINSLITDYIVEILKGKKDEQDSEYEHMIETRKRRRVYDRNYADKNDCLYFLTNKRKKVDVESQIVYEEKTVDKTETVKTKRFVVNNSYNDFIDL